MSAFNLTITNEGSAFLASVIANQGNIDFTEMRFSSTNYVGQEATLTAGTWAGTFITATPSASVVDLTTININGSFNNSSLLTDQDLYSIGLIADDGNGNTALVAVATTSTPDPISHFILNPSTYAYNIDMVVSSTANITVSASVAGVVFVSDIVDNLTSSNANKPLSANQGKVVADNIQAIVNMYGSKNLLPYPYYDTTKTENGLTFTDNGDGSITVSAGTASAETEFYLKGVYDNLSLNSNNLILSGCPAGGSASTYMLRFLVSPNGGTWTTFVNEIGEGASLSGWDMASYPYSILKIVIKAGTVISSPITFKPMIRDARITDDTYAPYAPTNRELMSFKANNKVGAKNLLPYPYRDTTKVDSGITYTVNSDGTVSMSGTASALSQFYFNLQNLYLPKGVYTVTGCPSYANGKYVIWVRTDDNSIYCIDNGHGGNFIVTDPSNPITVSIVTYDIASIPAAEPVTIKPMIRIAEDTDSTYTPFAKTNKELTDDVSALNSNSSIESGTNKILYASVTKGDAGLGVHYYFIVPLPFNPIAKGSTITMTLASIISNPAVVMPPENLTVDLYPNGFIVYTASDLSAYVGYLVQIMFNIS